MAKTSKAVILNSIQMYVVSIFAGIMLKCPCHVDPITPHFHIVKLGFTWV